MAHGRTLNKSVEMTTFQICRFLGSVCPCSWGLKIKPSAGFSLSRRPPFNVESISTPLPQTKADKKTVFILESVYSFFITPLQDYSEYRDIRLSISKLRLPNSHGLLSRGHSLNFCSLRFAESGLFPCNGFQKPVDLEFVIFIFYSLR